ncbi:hypothetical protein HYZ06_00630 [Candidatus Daviesbacteria bacterium]|nr:hypothetical protein [Candidatus Daviesbacteria bacterium]
MINTYRKLNVLIKLSFSILLLLIILWKLIDYFSYKESREHDRLPKILSKKVNMETVGESLYKGEEYKDGIKCPYFEQKTVLQVISEQDNSQYYTCKKFSTNRGNFYLIEKTSFALIILETTPGNFDLVIRDAGEYEDYKNYPGIYPFRMRGNQTDVIFIYEGWNNPKKIIKLTTN